MESLKEVKDQLIKNGFENSYPFNDYTLVQYKASNGNSFHIYLDETKPNRVATLRGMKPTTIMAFGLIGKFCGSGKVGRKFSFKTPEELKNKLENWLY
jgi:hypothetical protein